MNSECKGKGFFRPGYLHINPSGGVRTCMYAPGSGILGNITEISLLKIINNFYDNPLVSLFREDKLQKFVSKYFDPFLEIYKHIQHPCAYSALISRFAEELNSSNDSIKSINLRIANEYNLKFDKKK